MAGNIPKLVDKGFQNWIKANLALNITKEGIEDAVLTEINTFHQDTLNDILSPEQILNNDLCRQCKIENLLPCPTRGICIVKKGLCSFHYTQQKLFRPCPKHICDRLRDNIRRCHNFNFPSWKNTKAEYWCQNPWELAKCYLPPDGYLGVSSIAETDINGIVSVIMNLSAFKNKVNMHNCGQVREVTRTVRNSLDLCINDQDLNNILDTLVAFLSASLFHGDLKAATSVQNIAKLKMDSLTITTNFVTNILQDVTHENTKKSMQVMNEKQAERVHEINVDLDKLYEVAKVSAIDDIEGSRRTVIDDIKSTTVQLKTELNSDIDKVKTQAVAEIEEMKQTSIETEYQRLKTDGETHTATENSQKTLVRIKEQHLVKDDRTKDKRGRFVGVRQESLDLDGESHIGTGKSQKTLPWIKEQQLVKDDGTKDKRGWSEGSDLNGESHTGTENSQKTLVSLKEQQLVKDDGTKDKRGWFEGSDLNGESHTGTENSQKTLASLKEQQLVKDDGTKDKRGWSEGSDLNGESHTGTENSQKNLASLKEQQLVKDDGTKDKRDWSEGSYLNGESHTETENSQKTLASLKEQQLVKDDGTKDKRGLSEGSDLNGESHDGTENSQKTLASLKEQQLVKDDGTKDKRGWSEGSDLNGESHTGTENSQKTLASIKKQQLVKDDGTKGNSQKTFASKLNQLLVEIGRKKDESAQWQDCIQSKDAEKIRNLLQEGSLPDQKQLQHAYTTFMEENTDIIKEICLAIEEHITSKNNSIVSTHACYNDGRKSEIVFVILTSQAKDQLIDIRYPFHSIGIDDYDGDAVIERERQDKLSFDNDEFADLTECLRTNSPDLMEKHSNLTNTSISHFKSSKEDGLKKTSCIVFYVFAKGFIPVGEEPLPLYLKSQTKTYITDVRESRFAEISRGPDEEHKDLKTGCRIESSKVLDGGTLGAFVIHPKHGLCAVTCSHVLLDISQFKNQYQKKQKKEEVQTLTEIQCFQPKQPHKCGEIVDVRLFGTNERKYGMDIAFVKIDDSRKPITNNFPDILAKDLKGKRSPYLDALLAKTFQYNSNAVIQHPKNLSNVRHVVKYGAKSRLTTGEFFSHGSFARIQFCGHSFSDERIPRLKSNRAKFDFTDQIEIRDDGMIFSESGDSGAMVFITDENSELTALGILTGRKDIDGITYVTPIWNILEEIEMPMPYSLAENNPVSKLLERLERAVGDLKKHFNAPGHIIDQ